MLGFVLDPRRERYIIDVSNTIASNVDSQFCAFCDGKLSSFSGLAANLPDFDATSKRVRQYDYNFVDTNCPMQKNRPSRRHRENADQGDHEVMSLQAAQFRMTVRLHSIAFHRHIVGRPLL